MAGWGGSGVAFPVVPATSAKGPALSRRTSARRAGDPFSRVVKAWAGNSDD